MTTTGKFLADIFLVASNESVAPAGPAGYTLIGYWDVDGGNSGGYGTDGSTGGYMMALYALYKDLSSIGASQRVGEIMVTCSNQATAQAPVPPPNEPAYKFIGSWDVDGGTSGGFGTNGTRGGWMAGMYYRSTSTITASEFYISEIYLTACNNAYPSLPPGGETNDFHLVGYWDVDPGNSGGYGTDGSTGAYMMGLWIRYSPYETPWVLGDLSSALLPPSASSSLELTQSACVTFPSINGFQSATGITIEVWINALSASQTTTVLIFGVTDAWSLTIELENGIPIATLKVLVKDNHALIVASASAIDAIIPGVWVSIAVTYQINTDELIIYIDGIEINSVIDEAWPKISFDEVSAYLGCRDPLSSDQTLQAGIGRVLMWSSARSADEVLADLVNCSVIDPVAEEDLKLFVDFSTIPIVDESGNGNPISYVNGARLALLTPALMLDGASWVDVGGGAQLDFSNQAPFTIDGWFNAVAYGAPGSQTLVSRANPDSIEYLIEYLATGSGTGSLRFTRGTSVITSPQLPGNTWLHFAASFNTSNNAIYLYVNGNLQSTLIVDADVQSAATDTLIGASNANGSIGAFFEGQIQNCRFWNTSLSQNYIRQWLFNQPISDPNLVAGFDFSVIPPVDTVGASAIALNGGAVVLVQSIPFEPASLAATVGRISGAQASYLTQSEEIPLPPPSGSSTSASKMQRDIWSDDRIEENWNVIVAALPGRFSKKQTARLRQKFEANFKEARRAFHENPKLMQPISEEVKDGLTRLTYHSPNGDFLIYEGKTISDCQKWWLGFIFILIVGFVNIVFQLNTGRTFTGAMTTRIYNLIMRNGRVLAAITELILVADSGANQSQIAVAALGVWGSMFNASLIWPILKIVFSSLTWFAIAQAITRVVVWITGAEVAVAATLANVIVWVAQISYQLTSYTSSCPPEAPQG